MYLFPIVLEALGDKRRERPMWARVGFLLRAYSLENEEFAYVNKPSLNFAMKRFYEAFTSYYGKYNCRPNIHTVIF